MIANTPEPPYYMVVFTSTLSDNIDGYEAMARKMLELAAEQEGFLGVDTARSEIGITVSYWKDLESIRSWGANTEHLKAKSAGKSTWYDAHITRIAKVEKQY